jgi:acetyl esterase/lipase
VRVVRHSARAYGVDPDRLAVTGGSSGGHLSLWLATRGDDGNRSSPDPVERESSRVQSVACFFPATDLLNLGTSTENAGDDGPPRSYRAAFREAATNQVAWQAIGRDLSPIYHVTSELPPVLLIHGDSDTLIPLDQSERFVARALEEGVSRIELRVRPGRGHGWPSILWEVREIAAWFDATLRP